MKRSLRSSSMRKAASNQEKLKYLRRVLKKVRKESENRRQTASLSNMNRTSTQFEIGTKLFRERTGANGNNGTVRDVLELNRQQIKNCYELDGF